MSRLPPNVPHPLPVARLVRGGTHHPLPAPVRRSLGAGGFNLVEVMLAAIVLVLGITTASTTLQSGF